MPAMTIDDRFRSVLTPEERIKEGVNEVLANLTNDIEQLYEKLRDEDIFKDLSKKDIHKMIKHNSQAIALFNMENMILLRYLMR
jgi:hypothetical protein